MVRLLNNKFNVTVVLVITVVIICIAVLICLVIPPKFEVINTVKPDELSYYEAEFNVKTNLLVYIPIIGKSRLRNFMSEYIFENYYLDPTIFDFEFRRGFGSYIVKLLPKYINIHATCLMDDFRDKDISIDDYVTEFLIQSRGAGFVLDTKGYKRDFSEVLRTGAGLDYQYATMFWMLLQEKGIKSHIEYEDGVYYNVINGKRYDIGNNIYH